MTVLSCRCLRSRWALLAGLLLLSLPAGAQFSSTASRLRPVNALPATCSAPSVVYLMSAGMPYYCTGTGTWAAMGGSQAVTIDSPDQSLTVTTDGSGVHVVAGPELPTLSANNAMSGNNQINVQWLSTSGTVDGVGGVTQYGIAKLKSDGTVTKWLATDTFGALGIVLTPSTSTGVAQVTRLGYTKVFTDNAATAGHWAVASTTADTQCHDTGSSIKPLNGMVCGILTSSGASGLHDLFVVLEDLNTSIPDVYKLEEDFNCGKCDTTAAYGQLVGMWHRQDIAGTGTNVHTNGVSGHPGILRVSSGATSGNASDITIGYSGGYNIPNLSSTGTFTYAEFTVIFRLDAADITNSSYYLGLVQANANPPGDAVMLRYSTNANWTCTGQSITNFVFENRKSAVSSCTDSGMAAAANTWYKVFAYTTDGTTWHWTLTNYSTTVTGDTTNNVPTGPYAPSLAVATATSASKSLDMDYVSIKIRGLGR